MTNDRKNWGRPGELVKFTGANGESRHEEIEEERCWQCRKYSLVFYTTVRGLEIEECLNKCGPRELCKALTW